MQKGRLLIVDDEEYMLQTLTYLFEEFTIFKASNGFDAIQILEKNKDIDVIISDQRMPKMTGSEFLAKAKVMSPNTTRILLTGYSDLDATISSVNNGEIFRYIMKPWNRERLISTVELGIEYSRNARSKAVEATKERINHQFQNEKLDVIHSPSKVLDSSIKKIKPEIVFIDQNPKHLSAFQELLSSNFSLHSFTSALQAYEVIVQRPISILVTEVFSGDSGFQFNDFIGAVKYTHPHLVIIILTDSQDAEVAMKLVNQVNIYKYLIKPFKRSYLLESLAEGFKTSLLYKEHPESNPFFNRLATKHPLKQMPKSFEPKGINEAVRLSKAAESEKKTY
ncbi:MAG: response regulator [Chloroherpetonaceae bacterium]|nr:response regulator [Chloroherpetonaceae bacterium]